MKKLLSILFFLALVGSKADAGTLLFQAEDFRPSSIDTANCTLKRPELKCCEDNTGTSCNSQGCVVGDTCATAPFDTCAVQNGDSGRRCCTDGLAGDCQQVPNGEKEFLCDSNGDCTGNDTCTGINAPWECCDGPGSGAVCDTYDTCASAAYTNGSQLPLPRWACTDTNSPKLYAFKNVPNDISSGYELTCFMWWGSKSKTGNGVFKLRAVAVNSDATSAPPTRSQNTITSQVSQMPYWRVHSGTATFCIEDASTGNCCTSNDCKNKLVKLEVQYDVSSTIADAAEIRGAVCDYE